MNVRYKPQNRKANGRLENGNEQFEHNIKFRIYKKTHLLDIIFYQ